MTEVTDFDEFEALRDAALDTPAPSRRSYVWKCNRCETHAEDTSRHGVQIFAEHHMQTMHPVFAAPRKVARPGRPRLLRSREAAS